MCRSNQLTGLACAANGVLCVIIGCFFFIPKLVCLSFRQIWSRWTEFHFQTPFRLKKGEGGFDKAKNTLICLYSQLLFTQFSENCLLLSKIFLICWLISMKLGRLLFIVSQTIPLDTDRIKKRLRITDYFENGYCGLWHLCQYFN